MLQLRAEFLKLRRSRFLWVLLVGLVLVVGFLQLQTLRDVEGRLGRVESLLNPPVLPEWLAGENAPPGAGTASDHTREHMLETARSGLSIARTVNTPVGAAIAVAGLLASGLGAVVAVVLVSQVFGSEYQSGTLRLAVTAQPSRSRVFLSKVAGVAGAFAAGSLILLLAGSASGLYTSRVNVSSVPKVAWDSVGLATAPRLVLGPLLAMALFVSVSAVAFILTRSLVPGLILAAGVFVADYLLAKSFGGLARLTMTFNIWSLNSGFRGFMEQVSTTQLWPREYPVQAVSFARAGITVGLISVVLLSLAYWVFRSQEF